MAAGSNISMSIQLASTPARLQAVREGDEAASARLPALGVPAERRRAAFLRTARLARSCGSPTARRTKEQAAGSLYYVWPAKIEACLMSDVASRRIGHGSPQAAAAPAVGRARRSARRRSVSGHRQSCGRSSERSLVPVSRNLEIDNLDRRAAIKLPCEVLDSVSARFETLRCGEGANSAITALTRRGARSSRQPRHWPETDRNRCARRGSGGDNPRRRRSDRSARSCGDIATRLIASGYPK